MATIRVGNDTIRVCADRAELYVYGYVYVAEADVPSATYKSLNDARSVIEALNELFRREHFPVEEWDLRRAERRAGVTRIR